MKRKKEEENIFFLSRKKEEEKFFIILKIIGFISYAEYMNLTPKRVFFAINFTAIRAIRGEEIRQERLWVKVFVGKRLFSLHNKR